MQIHILLLLLVVPLSSSEFTAVMPDSSTLVDAPQTGFSSCARTDPGEQRAVYEIMTATGNSWAVAIPDVCRGRWHGIECMPDSDNVYHVVSLSFGALSDDTAFPTCEDARGGATLSPAVLRLPHLRSLFFYRCLSDNPQSIPAFLGLLGPALRSLVLRDNGHVGPIPQELGNLTSLRILDLHGNSLTSSIPYSLSDLTNLQLLDLSSNQLAGAIPELKLPSLSVLDLNDNLLHSKIPPSLANIEPLIKIDLSRNRLMGSIPKSLGSLKNLILLDLSHNTLSGTLPCPLGNGFPSLQALILKGNTMSSATIPKDCFTGMNELNTLILSSMELEGPVPESIGKMQSLRVLHLDGNKLNGSIPENFRRLGKLSELRLEGNRLTGTIPFEKEMMWRMGRKLKVSNNSGLCFDMGSVGDEGLDSMEGISYCDPETMAAHENTARERRKERTGTKHLSSWMGGGQSSIFPSRTSSAAPRSGFLQELILMSVIVYTLTVI